MLHKNPFFTVFLLLIHFQVSSQCNDEIKSGEATFYGGIAGSSGGNCSLPVVANDFAHCALNNTDYQNSNACGACLEVTGSRGKTIVKVVDRCPECKPGDVDLTQQTFAKIANPIDGRVPISWKFVPCPLVGNQTIKVNFKSGSSRYWTAIQFRDLKHSITKMEYFKNNSWINVKRALFNFFIEPGGIESPMKLRITSAVGEQLILDKIVINTNTDFDTKIQFKTPSNCQNPTNPTDTTDTTDLSFKPHIIPGRIEAEDFNNGGQSIGYNDRDTSNNGGQYRNEGVDIQRTGDSSGDFNVGWTNTNEWLEYTVDVNTTNNYDLTFRTASIFATSSFQVSVDGTSITDVTSVPNTNNWQRYTTITIPNIRLTAGKRIFRISTTQSGFNLNYWSAIPAGANKSSFNNFKNDIDRIKGYPNPTASIFYIQGSISNWALKDINGRIILKGSSDFVDLSSFNSGNYFLQTDTTTLQIITI